MSTPKPLGPQDSMSATFTPQQRRIDQARRSPAQQEAKAALRQLVLDKRITEGEWRRVMSLNLADLWPEVERLSAPSAEQQQQADQAATERLARWQRFQASLEPDSPSAHWRDITIGAGSTERLRTKWAGVTEPPADWVG